jgi:hypothetical protein
VGRAVKGVARYALAGVRVSPRGALQEQSQDQTASRYQDPPDLLKNSIGISYEAEVKAINTAPK